MNGRTAKKLRKAASRMKMTPGMYRELKRQWTRTPWNLRTLLNTVPAHTLAEIGDDMVLDDIAKAGNE